MKTFFNNLFYLLVIFSFENSAYSLSENQIKEICKKKQRRLICENNLKSRKLNLFEGKRIEIPVIPFNK